MSEGSETLGDTLVWRIKKFSFCLLKKDEYLETSLPPSTNSPKLIFRLYPNGKTKDGGVMPLCMTLEWQEDVEDGILCFTTSVVSADGYLYSENGADEIMFLEPGVFRAVPLRCRDKLYEKSSLYLPEDTLTIYCRIWNPEKRMEVETMYRFCTEIPTIQYAGMWKIEKFSAWRGEEKTFPVTGMICAVVSLRKNYQKSPVGEDLHIEWQLWNCPTSFLKITVSIFPRKKAPIKKVSFSSEKSRYYYSRLLAKQEILKNSPLYLQDDTLILQFEVLCDAQDQGVETNNSFLESMEISSTKIPVIKAKIKKDKESALADELLSLYTEKTCGDVTLRAGDWQCLAHISILSARSPVFRAMFQHKTVEAATKIVDIPDVGADTLHWMLRFMYGNRFREDMKIEDVIELFVAADKYQIQCLKTICFDFIKSGLSVKNVCRILSVADFRQEINLKKAALDFITVYSDEVLNSPEWEDFKADEGELAAEAMRQLCTPKQCLSFDQRRKRSFAEMSKGCSSQSDTIVAGCSKVSDNSSRKELASETIHRRCTSGTVKKEKLITEMSGECGFPTSATAAECSEASDNSRRSELTSILNQFFASRFGADIKKRAFSELSNVCNSFTSPTMVPLDFSKLSTDNKGHPSAEAPNGCNSDHETLIASCSNAPDNSPQGEPSSQTTDQHCTSNLNTDHKKQPLPKM